LIRLKIISDKRGGKGMLPACCLPLWGREGVTLTAAADNYRMTEKKDFNRAQRSLKEVIPVCNTISAITVGNPDRDTAMMIYHNRKP
jgi:hypothetical protein